MTADRHGSASQAEEEAQATFEGADDAATLRLAAGEPSVAKEKVGSGACAFRPGPLT